MKFLVVLILGPVFGCLYSCRSEEGDRPADWSGPIAVAETRDHDFGALFAGARVEASFVIENRGARDLELIRSHADCGCTRPRFDRQVVSPGDRALMTVELIAPSIHNATRKRIEVYTNDPYASRLEFGMIMQGMGQASIQPTHFSFDEVVGPEGLTRPLDLKLPPGHKLQSVTGILKQASEPTASEIEIRVADLRAQTLELFIRGPREKLILRDYVQFRIVTTNEEGKEVFLQPQGLQLEGELRPRWQFEPGLLDFGWLKRGETRECVAHLLREGKAVEGRPISEDEEITVEKGKAKGEFIIRLAARSPGSLRRLLTFETEDGQELKLPVLAWKHDG